MRLLRKIAFILVLCLYPAVRADENPKWMICTTDQLFNPVDEANNLQNPPRPGAIVIMNAANFSEMTSKILQNIPCGMIGPPTGIAITPDQKFALITSSMKLDPTTRAGQVSNNKLTVVRLMPEAEVIQTLALGLEPTGVDITRDGKRALVVNRRDGTISILELARNGTVTEAERLSVAPPAAKLSDASFSPDGTKILASMYNENSIILLESKDNSYVIAEKIPVDKGPYQVTWSHDGKQAFVGNTGDVTLMILDMDTSAKTGKGRIIDRIAIGKTPEGFSYSQDGKWIAVSCMEDSLLSPETPTRRESGMVMLLKRHKKTFMAVDILRCGRIPQAVCFTPDSLHVGVGSFENREIEFYAIEKDQLITTSKKISCDGGPSAMAISH